MDNNPVLIIMAAGLGSRYGGLKQIAPVDGAGHIIMDFSIYDAKRAGFETVICVIKPGAKESFDEKIGSRIAAHTNLQYAYQELDNLPEGFTLPEGRTKPWGTAHAVLSAKNLVNSPFAVINADDYYGPQAFKNIYGFLSENKNENQHAMVGYLIENTLTENGSVARGICDIKDDKLAGITERTHVEPRSGGAAYTDDGDNFVFLQNGTIVSMNMWGFKKSVMDEIESGFTDFLTKSLPDNPLKCEYYLPSVPNDMLNSGKAEIFVLPTTDKWYGITYADDMPRVHDAIKDMKAKGLYPEYLWK